MRNTRWRYIEEDKVSASYGLGADEFLMDKQSHPDNKFPVALRLYTYKDYCALAGRFQDIKAEIDIENCEHLGYEYNRRLTGGGAIIMGSGQLGVCLTTHGNHVKWEHIRELYTLFSEPLIIALRELGIEASFRSKNDLEVNGKKIAGLGVHVSPEGGIQFHASLLVNLDVNAMLQVLNIPVQKFSDKIMVRTVEQRITTVMKESEKPVDIDTIRTNIARAYRNYFEAEMVAQPISGDERDEIEQVEKERYNNPDWIFQYSPQSDMTGMGLKKTPAGLLRAYIGLKGETIKSVLITGDFFEQDDVLGKIELDLKWGPLDKEKIQRVVEKYLSSEPSGNSPVGLSASDVTDVIWLASQRAFAANRYTYKGSCYYPKEEKIAEKV